MDVPPAAKPRPERLPPTLPATSPFLSNSAVRAAGPSSDSSFAKQTHIHDWTSTLDPRSLPKCYPRWHRVPTPAASLLGRRRKTVMKRVGTFFTRTHRYTPSRPVDKHYNDKENEVSEPRRRRLGQEGPHDPPAWAPRPPFSSASNDYRRAKINVIQHIALHPDSAFDYSGRDDYLGGLIPISRDKRRVDWTRAPGATLAFYRDLLGLVVRAWEYYGMNIVKTDLVQHMIDLEGMRRDPTVCLAAIGAPGYCLTADMAEPDAEFVPSQPPATPAAPRSSARRKARLSDYIAAGSSIARSADAGAAIGQEPQPSPPKHNPSTLLIDFGSSPATPVGAAPKSAEDRPKVFRAPSYDDSTTMDESQTFAAENGPTVDEMLSVKRPGAPTPSRLEQVESAAADLLPETPKKKSSPADAAKESLGLVASVPDVTTSPIPTPPSWKKWENKATADTFQFSGASFEDTQASDHYSVFGSKSDRRRSEPLLQHLLKDRARRFSASPQKFFAGSDRFDAVSDAAPATPVRPQRPQKSGIDSVDVIKVGGDGDFYTPLPSYFKTNLARDSRNVNDTPANSRGVYNIDMRENPDIFGARPQPPPVQKSAVEELAQMAEDKCDGDASVVAAEENGKLVVRFKLPTKYASFFPGLQGHEESRFTTTPSAVSSSPRVRFELDQSQVADSYEGAEKASADDTNPACTDPADKSGAKSSSLSEIDSPPKINGLGAFVGDNFLSSPVGPSSDGTLIVSDFGWQDLREQSNEATRSSITSGGAQHDTSVLTPTRQLLQEAADAPSSSIISDVSFNPTFQTPTFGNIDFSPSRSDNVTPTASKRAPKNGQDAQGATPSGAARMRESDDATSPLIPGDDHLTTNGAKVAITPPAVPSITMTSFTPVNKPTTESRPCTPRSAENGDAAKTKPTESEVEEEAAEETAARTTRIQYDDSPGRDFIHDFIRRSRPKKPMAETGSPVPDSNSAARVPLGAKSPNSGSPVPRMEKRKLDEESAESESPSKEAEQRPAKKPRPPSTPLKKAESVSNKVGKQTDAGPRDKVKEAPKRLAKASIKPTTSTSRTEPAGNPEGPPRRSTRLRGQPSGRETGPQKSSIPTAIKIGRPGMGRTGGGQVLNSSVRNEQAELTRQTSLNTKKNKGGAESVQKVLARCSEELSGEDTDDATTEPKASKTGKNVSWMDPIASHQQTPKAKKSKTAATKSKPKPAQGDAGVSKARAPPKKAMSQAARNLGMASNGTPAKRMTRAQTKMNV